MGWPPFSSDSYAAHAKKSGGMPVSWFRRRNPLLRITILKIAMPPKPFTSDALTPDQLKALQDALEEWFYLEMLYLGDHEYGKAAVQQRDRGVLPWWMTSKQFLERDRGSERSKDATSAVAVFSSPVFQYLSHGDESLSSKAQVDIDRAEESLIHLFASFGCYYEPWDEHWSFVYCNSPEVLDYPFDYRLQMDDPRWRETSEIVRKWANWRCFDCRKHSAELSPDNKLQSHHTYYKKHRAAWQYPLQSLVAVCGECHCKRDHRHRHVDLQWQLLRCHLRGPEMATLIYAIEQVLQDPGERFRFRELMNRLSVSSNRRKMGALLGQLEPNPFPAEW